MNEEILKTMPEYVRNLPKSVQDFIFDGIWQERTEEIAKKYSLNEKQNEDLVDNVLYVLIGLEEADVFVSKIIEELGISRLLAEQIMEDLEVRVFEYAVKSLEKKEEVESRKSKVEGQEEIQNSNGKKDEEIPDIQPEKAPETKPEMLPEIEPNILPVVEEGEVAHDVPKPQESTFDNQAKPTITEKVEGVTPAQRPPEPVSQKTDMSPEPPKPELVQKPFSVPRVDVSQENKVPEPVSEPPKQYTVDPYREPIE